VIRVEAPRLGRPEALFGERQDFPHDAAARGKCPNFVTDAQRVTRARRLSVHLHVVGFAGRLRERSRFEQARGEQEAIESHRLVQATPIKDLAPEDQRLRVARGPRRLQVARALPLLPAGVWEAEP